MTFEPWFWEAFWEASLETFTMVGISLAISTAIGLPLGIILVLTKDGGLLEQRGMSFILNIIINIIRSIPFIILVVAAAPLTKLIMGTTIGMKAAIVPLVLYTAFYIARLVENSLLEVEHGVYELAQSVGASTWQTIWRFLLPEARSSLILAFTVAIIGLIGASAMAGAVGAGGIGNLAIVYGYNQNKTEVTIITVIALIILVQAVQSLGNHFAIKLRK